MPQSEGGTKKFKIGELFTSANGDFDIQKTHLNGRGVDVISSGESNNGVIGKTDVLARIFSANTFLSPNQDIGLPESKITTSVQHSKVPLEQARSFLVTLETCWAEEGT